VSNRHDEPELQPRPASIEVGRWPTVERAEEHAVVLQAMGIGSAVVPIETEAADRYRLIVQSEDAERARDELRRFVGENRGWPPRAIVPPRVTVGVGGGVGYAGLMVLAFAAERQGSYGIDWLHAGRADAGLIRSGEWWRVVTALGLHADAVHLAGNLVFGALFGVMFAQSVGSGLTWLTFVVAGGIGNGMNAWWQEPSHLAIGASTGVFGLLGAQVACDWMRRGRIRHHAMRRWAPIIMGIALLAWLGGSGQGEWRRVDVSAAVLGARRGVGGGAQRGARRGASLQRPRVQGALTAAAIGLVVLAWTFAVR